MQPESTLDFDLHYCSTCFRLMLPATPPTVHNTQNLIHTDNGRSYISTVVNLLQQQSARRNKYTSVFFLFGIYGFPRKMAFCECSCSLHCS
ncbi:hypothetical protein MtrunA17_Chr4g0024871 [Medicago truncatula]|uniref:Uncharacterized protein n=1 Tax=Medicago truncatula TaxID=3880 RepID=A0A396I6J1_MEDTR|nr:hypothetical protein MtrunA17_Chr4g0024871 [Medicago truncatula]